MLVSLAHAQTTTREKILFNFDWKFKKGDTRGAYQKWVDESTWQDVQLPHDAAVGGEFSRENSTRANACRNEV